MIYGEDKQKNCGNCDFWIRHPSEDDNNGYEYGLCSELPRSISIEIEVESGWVNQIKTEVSFSCSLHV